MNNRIVHCHDRIRTRENSDAEQRREIFAEKFEGKNIADKIYNRLRNIAKSEGKARIAAARAMDEVLGYLDYSDFSEFVKAAKANKFSDCKVDAGWVLFSS